MHDLPYDCHLQRASTDSTASALDNELLSMQLVRALQLEEERAERDRVLAMRLNEMLPRSVHDPVLMEDIPGEDVFTVRGCGHSFARDTMRHHILACIDPDGPGLPPLCPTCQLDTSNGDVTEIGNDESVLVLSPEEQGRFLKCEQKLNELQLRSNFKPCPQCLDNAQAVAWVDAGEFEATCPECSYTWCWACQSAWHQGQSCVEFKASTDRRMSEHAELLLDEQALDLAERMHWKRCPTCQTMVEKNQGCNTMTCICKTIFCYVCGQNLSRMDRTSSHFPCGSRGQFD